jgi:hypothetical protein
MVLASGMMEPAVPEVVAGSARRSVALQVGPRLAIYGIPGGLTDPTHEDRSVGIVVKPRKRNPVGRRASDGRNGRPDIGPDLRERVKGIRGKPGDEK